MGEIMGDHGVEEFAFVNSRLCLYIGHSRRHKIKMIPGHSLSHRA